MSKKEKQDNPLFNEEVMAKLKDAKKALQAEEQERMEEEEAKRLFEKKQREKNMSFAELLEKHGDQGDKY